MDLTLVGAPNQALQRTASTELVCQGVKLQWLPRPLSLVVRPPEARVINRQKLLAEKLAANSQRLLRTAYLNALPASLRTELEPARFLCLPDDAAVRRHSHISARGVGVESTAVPSGFVFREFSWPEQAYAAVAAYISQYDGESGWLRPFQVRRFAGQTMTELFGELPTFAVQFGWARQHLPALFEASLNGVALVSESLRAGIVLQVVLGYLEPDPNPAERIYELATWGYAEPGAAADRGNGAGLPGG